MAVTTISFVNAEQGVAQNDNTTDTKSEVVDEQTSTPEEVTQNVEETEEEAAPAKKEESNNIATYALIAGALAAVGYAVYRKRRKATKKVDGFDESDIRVIRHKELTMDYILENDAAECVKSGATELNLCRVEYFKKAMPNVKFNIKDIDDSKSIISIGVGKDQEPLFVILHAAQSLDEKLSAVVNSENTLKIKM